MRLVLALFAFCILSATCSAASLTDYEPCCIACANCECDGDCLCPKDPERYVLSGDWWSMVYEPEHEARSIAEMVAGTIRWSGFAWGSK